MITILLGGFEAALRLCAVELYLFSHSFYSSYYCRLCFTANL